MPNDLRNRLDAGESVLMPGAWDALSARLAGEAGFSTVFLSGYCVSGTQLALPDYGFLTQTEMAEQARRTTAANRDLNVVVDGDTGYGNPLNVIRTIELWEAAGAAGVFLEDQVWPKRCGHLAGKQVVPADAWLAKLRAAVDHRTDLLVCARTDARAAEGLDGAIERAKAAVDAGVDAVFVEAPEDIAEMERIAAEVDAPVLVANMVEAGRTPLLTPAELTDLGFQLVVSPLTSLFTMVRAVRESLAVLAEKGSLRDELDRLVAFDDFTDLVGLPEVAEAEDRYRP
ncbi:MAG: isocitrate lyase/PEP mutase family protein [Acidimicrobiales bacterium]